MEGSAEKAAEAAAALQAGSQLLKRYGCGENLQVEIDQTLKVRRSGLPPPALYPAKRWLLEKLRDKRAVVPSTMVAHSMSFTALLRGFSGEPQVQSAPCCQRLAASAKEKVHKQKCRLRVSYQLNS